jgi:4-hydroxy-4-methyl-2-oxoglutarate aldolase
VTLAINQPSFAPLPPGLHDRWHKIPVAVAVDLDPTCQISPAIRPLRPAGQQPHLCARAVTAQCAPPDFGAVLAALEHVSPGQVLVIAAGGHPDNAMIGDILGGHLHRRGAAGIVCDGAIRDTATLASLKDFSVYTRHINPRGPIGGALGTVNHPVTIAGITITPGDLILGDDDGLAALSPEKLITLIDAAEARLRLEAEWTRQLAAGTPVRQIFGLD